ncbi:MAG: methyltransferase domain-containing protein [Planctomycetaceae bacterium]
MLKRTLLAVMFLLLCGGSFISADEDAGNSEDSPRYTFRELHDPNGIGKFYMGREIARVMGHQGINWLERPEREREEGLSLLVESLKLKPGMVVADIGAGSGVISTLIAEEVGPEGTVLAVDIQQEMLDALAAKCKTLGIENVEPILGNTKSPSLNPGTVDLVIMVDVYHEFDFPYEMLSEIAKSLKPGGRVAFVEYRKEDPLVPIKEVHKMSQAQVKKEAEQPEFGLSWKETVDALPRQHVVLFEKVAPADAPE